MQGAGFVCVWVLDSLATQALKINNTQLMRPEIKADDDVPAEYISNENEIILEKLEEEQNAMVSDDSDDDEQLGLNLNFRSESARKTRNVHQFTTEHNLSDTENWRYVVL